MSTRTRSAALARAKIIAPILCLGFGWAACVGPAAPGPKTQLGAATGAAAGGLIGAAASDEAESIIAGVLLGGLLGGAVGNALDDADRVYAGRNRHHGLEYARSGSSSEWYNPDTGHHGSITPTRTYRTAYGRYCREFTQEVHVGGRIERAYGTACRAPDGSWRIER